jgi:hypothetical protein
MRPRVPRYDLLLALSVSATPSRNRMARVLVHLRFLVGAAGRCARKTSKSNEEVDRSPKEVRALLERLRELAREAKEAVDLST